MAKNKRNRWTVLGVIAVILSGLGLLSFGIAQGPDKELQFKREVKSQLDIPILTQAVERVINWPQWHHNMARVKLIDLRGEEYVLTDQIVTAGSRVKFEVQPPKKPWKRFEMIADVIAYEPGKLIRLRLLKDSTGRLTQLFSNLEWSIEFVPNPEGGVLIRGMLKGRTSHWRSRFFGTLTPRVFLHQVYYPDLLKLAGLKEPLSVNPLPQAYH